MSMGQEFLVEAECAKIIADEETEEEFYYRQRQMEEQDEEDAQQQHYDNQMASEAADLHDKQVELFKEYDSVRGREDFDGMMQDFQERFRDLGVTGDDFLQWKYPIADESIPF